MFRDFRHLLVFAKVVENGSFRGAAKELDTSTATTSLAVTKLEESYGVALLYRSTRKLSLTHDGQAVFDIAKQILKLYTDNLGDFLPQAYHGRGRLKITLPSVLMGSDLLDRVVDFAKLEPNLQLDLRFSDNQNDIIGEGIDLAVRLGNMPNSNLKARKIFELSRVLVASNDLIDEHGTPAHPSDLMLLPWIGLTMRPNKRTFVHPNHGSHDIRYEPIVTVDSVDAAYRLATMGVGIAAPPSFLYSCNDGLSQLIPEWSLPPLPAYAVWPSNSPKNHIAKKLVEHLGSSRMSL